MRFHNRHQELGNVGPPPRGCPCRGLPCLCIRVGNEEWEHQIWNSDEFNPLVYGVDYNFGKKFFGQYKNFQLSVPRQSLNVINAVNSEFTNYSNNVKNCYLVTDAANAEDCQHSTYVDNSKNCHYSYGAISSDSCYECN